MTMTCLAWSVDAGAGGPQPSFPDIASNEHWIDGPDAVQPGTQRAFPDVAVDDQGRRIHVWNASGGGLFNDDVFMRRWDSEGNPLGDPVQVNTTVDEPQKKARVAVSGDGSFLVIFQSFEPAPGGVDRIMVRSQAYDADGNAVGPEELLSTTMTLDPSDVFADVAALRTADGSSGGYAVVWKSNQATGGDTNDSIEGCMVSAVGVPGTQFQVNSDAAGNQNWPSVTELEDGGFLAVWDVNNDIWGRRFNAAGAPQGNDFQINTFADAAPRDTDVAIGWDGRVLVVWEDAGDDAGTSTEIRGRLYDADLMPLGPDFRINTVTDDTQSDARIADYGPVGFLVVWHSDVASGPDMGDSIEARVVTGPNTFDHDGDGTDDPQVQLNVWDNDNNQQFPGAHGWYGRMATDWDTSTWNGNPPPINPNDDFIVGRDIEHCLFCDDFDWHDPGSLGSLWRWDSVVGSE
jgi:hypothetical protein